MSKPLIQIDDEIREMTDEEFLKYQEIQQNQSILENQNDAE